jgi:hypothetical protein
MSPTENVQAINIRKVCNHQVGIYLEATKLCSSGILDGRVHNAKNQLLVIAAVKELQSVSCPVVITDAFLHS